MYLKIVEAVYTVVTGELGHSDQYLYIDLQLWLARDPPPWARLYIQKGKGKIMVPKLTDNKKEILQSLDRDDLPLPPYWVTRLPSNSPPGPEAALPNPGPAGAPEAALPPAPLGGGGFGPTAGWKDESEESHSPAGAHSLSTRPSGFSNC